MIFYFVFVLVIDNVRLLYFFGVGMVIGEKKFFYLESIVGGYSNLFLGKI